MRARQWTAMVGLVVLGLVVGAAPAAVTFSWVTVGNPGNPANPEDGNPHTPGVQSIGAVANTFLISAHETTNDQYAAFLNAVAASDPNGLYSANMEIAQSGSDGSFTYAVDAGTGSRPVWHVNFFDVMRFVNWLENGQPIGAQGSGTTEDGVYTVSDGISETRAPGASVFLPNDDEWYKAAYYDPGSGPGDHYWLYPTQSDSIPTGEAPPGGANSVNFNSAVGDLTDAGAYTTTTSFYGAFDMGGNLAEFNEGVYDGRLRYLRGGAFMNNEVHMGSDFLNAVVPSKSGTSIGFRVAMVPEPASALILVLGFAGAALRRNRR